LIQSVYKPIGAGKLTMLLDSVRAVLDFRQEMLDAIEEDKD
jgi:hypothetical protein